MVGKWCASPVDGFDLSFGNEKLENLNRYELPPPLPLLPLLLPLQFNFPFPLNEYFPSFA